MEALKKKRSGIKQSLTKFTTFINNFNVSTEQITKLKLRLEMAEKLWDRFDAIQSEIEEIEEGESEEASEQQRSAFEEPYFDVISRAREFVSQLEQPLTAAAVSDIPVVMPSRTQLPVLTLPKFNGEYTKWLSFKDSFQSTIHTNASLPAIEKFRYLRSLLTGDALQLLSALETTNENYTIAWTLLNNRYENERIIIHNHMKALFDMPSLVKETHVNLRQTIDTFQIHIRALETLKEPVNSWDTILIYLLLNKLDTKTRRDWEIETGDKKKPTLQELLTFLANRCQILEMSETVNKISITISWKTQNTISQENKWRYLQQ